MGLKMKRFRHQPLNQSGFIPLLLTIIFIVIVLVYLVYTRVSHAQQ